MEKTLLSILNAEQQLIDRIARCENEIRAIERDRDRIKASPYECKAKTNDLERCDNLISNYRQEAADIKQKLDGVRKEMQEYLVNLFGKEGGNAT